jgi:3-dehydroquinate dehydratase-2
MPDFMLINGPNINLLGKREPELYGNYTLQQLEQEFTEKASEWNCNTICFQSNSEADLVDKIQENAGNAFIIINPAAFTHTSIALRDALSGTSCQFIEVHITNPVAREAFRKTSYFSDIAVATIAGFGIRGYFFALEYAYQVTTNNQGS